MILAFSFGALFSLDAQRLGQRGFCTLVYVFYTLSAVFSMMLTIPVTVVIRTQGKMRKSSTSGVV